ncbi:hypothetical protein HAX54_005477, partial [Datura stramonium]|nr:hypothetical protein [Datura stramonium]
FLPFPDLTTQPSLVQNTNDQVPDRSPNDQMASLRNLSYTTEVPTEDNKIVSSTLPPPSIPENPQR